jgi:MerR family mercuric resistance operon transcriptional regulator/MerR family gold-responsive transcriptional activator of gol and ges genes
MQIGELAKRTALTVDAIRFYEKRRLLPKPVRSPGRFRLYTDDDTERLRFIQQVQGLGFSLTEIRELIDLRTRKVDACESVRQLVKDKLSDVRAKMQELKGLESELMADLQKCNQELKRRQRHAAGACPVLEFEGVRK